MRRSTIWLSSILHRTHAALSISFVVPNSLSLHWPREQQLLSGLLDVMHHLTISLKYRAELPPSTHKEAVMLIRDFESLLDVPQRSGLDEILRGLTFVPAWEENKKSYFMDSDLMRRNYREFGREVNHQVGEHLFSVG